MRSDLNNYMPSPNVVKQFTPDGYYHVYNRGVEKRDIFLDAQDFNTFLGLIQDYVTPQKEDDHTFRFRKDIAGEVQIICYCLMPNHYHLLLHQTTERGVSDFIRCVSTSYSMYFNRKYQRVGKLFQGVYKASNIFTDEYLLHLSRYIHLNPISVGGNYASYPYSSYNSMQAGKVCDWIEPNILFQLAGGADLYKNFTDDYAGYKETLGKMAID